jgi:hypothetical protein
VVASRGGGRLARALASVAWASERAVLDPGGLLVHPVPDGVAWHGGSAEPAALVRTPWVLLLAEDETLPAELVRAIGAALTDPAGACGYRIDQEVIGFGSRFRLRGAPVRLARREDARLVLGAGLGLGFAVRDGRVARLEPPVLVHGGERLADAVVDLDADAATLAALLAARDVRPGRRHLIVAPLVAGGRVLAARRVLAAAWGRWFLAILAGYRTVVAYAKLWERRRLAGHAA